MDGITRITIEAITTAIITVATTIDTVTTDAIIYTGLGFRGLLAIIAIGKRIWEATLSPPVLILSHQFPMRYKFLCLVLSLEVLVLTAPILGATDLRGRVVGLAGPRVGVGVALFEVKPDKRFRLVRRTVTAPDGKYYFNNIHAGQYVLRIGGIDHPLEVGETQMQDIPVIAPPHR